MPGAMRVMAEPRSRFMKFPRRARINSQAEFRRVFAQSAVSRDPYFKVLFRDNGRDHARLGMAVSRRICRHASGRNRLKRLIRESFRAHQQQLAAAAGHDLVVMPTEQAAAMCNRSLRESLEGHWKTVSGRARASS